MAVSSETSTPTGLCHPALPGSNVLDFAIRHGLTPVKVGSTHGGEYACPCPLCGGRDRFRIWPEQNNGAGSFWCRQCGAHGDRIQFVMQTQQVPFVEAAQITGDTDRIRMKTRSASDYSKPDTPRVPGGAAHTSAKPLRIEKAAFPILWIEKAEKLAVWACGKMPGSEGSEFLKKRGIGEDAFAQYELGWIPEDIFRPREAWGLDTILMSESDASGNRQGEKFGGERQEPFKNRPKRLWIPRGITIPHRNRKTGQIDRIRIRRPSGEPRYYMLPGSSAGAMFLGDPEDLSVVVVESELDAILIDYLLGDITATLAIGSALAKPDSETDAILQHAACLLIALDNDDAGKKGASWWISRYKRARRWPVPQGKDPSEAYASGVDLREWLISGWPCGMRIATASIRKYGAKRYDICRDDTSASPAPANPGNPKKPDNAINLADQDTPERPEAPDLSASIHELHGILKRHPHIRIIMTETRMALEAPEDWKRRHPELFRRMSMLVFFDSDVFQWLHEHPDNVINRENFLNKQEKGL